MNNKVLSMLGLCMSAGKLSAGEVAVAGAIKSKKAFLVIISEDASENTKKKFLNSVEFYKVNLVFYGEKEVLGKAIGKADRSALAVCDMGFAKKILTLLEEQT